MGECRFIIGTVNQGKLRVGETYSAYQQNTIFLSGLCTADSFLDEPVMNPQARGFLKNLGGLCLELTSIVKIDDSSRVAELIMVGDSKEKYYKAIQYLFTGNMDGYGEQQLPIMTLTPKTALRVGDKLGVSYLSILSPEGEGQYTLKHDYPIERTQGPRYENYQ